MCVGRYPTHILPRKMQLAVQTTLARSLLAIGILAHIKKRRSKNLLSVIRLGLLVFCVFHTAKTLCFRRKVCEYQRVLFSSENYRLGSIRTRSKNKCNASVTHFLITHTELLYRHALWDGKLSIYCLFFVSPTRRN